jgi:short-subunit dehydrogenase
MDSAERTAVIIGASSGIGEALARELHKAGWQLGLLARSIDKLKALAADLGTRVSVAFCDVSKSDCIDTFNAMADGLDGADLVIISAGCGYLSPTHNNGQDAEMVSVNITGFMAIAQAACAHFQKRGHGHLAAITSVAALRGNGDGMTYAASKAFQSVYLDGLRHAMRQAGVPVTITELQPGFVDTAMMKTKTPLSPLSGAYWLLMPLRLPDRCSELFTASRSTLTFQGDMRRLRSCSDCCLALADGHGTPSITSRISGR